MNNNDNNQEKITRKDAIKKIGNYGKYAALTAVGTYMLLNPQKAQAWSGLEGPSWGAAPGDAAPDNTSNTTF